MNFFFLNFCIALLFNFLLQSINLFNYYVLSESGTPEKYLSLFSWSENIFFMINTFLKCMYSISSNSFQLLFILSRLSYCIRFFHIIKIIRISSHFISFHVFSFPLRFPSLLSFFPSLFSPSLPFSF